MARSRSVDGGVLRRALKLGRAALLLALAPATLGSCTADSVSLRITCNVVPDADCTYAETGLCFLGGMLNLSAGTGTYFSVLRVVNGLKSRESDIPPQSEPNGVQVRELEIHLTDGAGREPSFSRALPNPYTVPATGSIEPGEEALVGAELLPAAYVAALIELNNRRPMGSVRLSIIVRGKTSGEVDVESGEWRWNIRLVDVNTNAVAGECTPFEDQVCLLGQDAWGYACHPATVDD